MASAEFQQVLELLKTFGDQVEAPQGASDEDRVKTMRGALDLGLFPVPEGTRVESLQAGGIPAEWIRSADADPDQRLLYIHGGGFIAGSLDSHRALSGGLSAASGCSVLAIDYRLAPEHPFPAGVEDCQAAARWIAENGPEGASDGEELFRRG